MGIGKRVPISIMTFSHTDGTGGSTQEVYTSAKDTWAEVKMRKSMLNSDGGGTELFDVYIFQGVRFDDDFIPNKTMQILYNGVQLTINSILLNDADIPPYYTLTASKNG